jgi:hypothetical protein
MEATIATLEYTLKDEDIKAQPTLFQQIQQVVDSLRKVMISKRQRWAEQEEKDGNCPCGCG